MGGWRKGEKKPDTNQREREARQSGWKSGVSGSTFVNGSDEEGPTRRRTSAPSTEHQNRDRTVSSHLVDLQEQPETGKVSPRGKYPSNEDDDGTHTCRRESTSAVVPARGPLRSWESPRPCSPVDTSSLSSQQKIKSTPIHQPPHQDSKAKGKTHPSVSTQ